MSHQAPPFRADHVGSLLRPPELLRAREEFAQKRITADELRTVEDKAVREAVTRQEDIGLRSVTDGEFRRAGWHLDFLFQLGGVVRVQDDARVHWRNEKGVTDHTPPGVRVVDKLTLEYTIFGDHFRSVRSMATRGTPKLTIPSLNMLHYRSGRAAIDPNAYPELEDFWSDLSSVYAAEIHGLAELGCTYLQLDDTSLAYLNDPRQRQEVADRGDDPDRLHLRYISNINEVLADRPAGLSVTTHMCRGNMRSSWLAEGGYEFVAEALFSELQVDGFFLEFDDERSGGFEPLRFVPPGKRVVLGLVTSKRGALESKDDLKRRIEEASQFVSLDQLCISPQCGFASAALGNDLTDDQQWAKLELLVQVANEVWGDNS